MTVTSPTELRRVWRFATQECRRLLRRPRLWVLTAAVVAFGAAALLFDEFPEAELRLGGSLALGVPLLLSLLWPLLAGVSAGGSVAEDRRSGYLIAVLARGLTRSDYLLGKAFAMAAVPALAALLCHLLFYALLAMKLPSGVSVVHTAPPGSPHWLDPLPGPSPYLFLRNPYLNDLLGVAIAVSGVAALGLTGVLVGVLTTSEPLAIATPTVLFVATAYLPRSLQFLGVDTYLDPWLRYRLILPPAAWHYAGLLYWAIWGSVALVVALVIFHRTESR